MRVRPCTPHNVHGESITVTKYRTNRHREDPPCQGCGHRNGSDLHSAQDLRHCSWRDRREREGESGRTLNGSLSISLPLFTLALHPCIFWGLRWVDFRRYHPVNLYEVLGVSVVHSSSIKVAGAGGELIPIMSVLRRAENSCPACTSSRECVRRSRIGQGQHRKSFDGCAWVCCCRRGGGLFAVWARRRLMTQPLAILCSVVEGFV